MSGPPRARAEQIPCRLSGPGLNHNSVDGLVCFADDVDMMIDKIYLITRPDFFPFARLDFSVNTDQAVSDRQLDVAATVAQSFEFENFVKFDEFCFEFRDNTV